MEYFPEIGGTIVYEGPATDNPLAYRYYQKDRLIEGKPMAEHLRFAVAYWHSLKQEGGDPFGRPTLVRAWNDFSQPMDRARATCDAAFELIAKLDVPFYCFHDRDLAPEGATFSESCRNLESMVSHADQLQKETGVRLLWGTANLFSHPRYAHGAGTNPDFGVFAYAAAQVKHALLATQRLGGENYVFWGGREGYETLLNTDMKREQEQLAAFLHLACDYARRIGFTGQMLIEPKPKEPTKHQYDCDVATVLGFLQTYNLIDHFKVNVEANHATLAGHSFEHELTVAAIAGRLGSIDINRGDGQLGWDTDQFPTDIYSNTMAMLVILEHGGLGCGGMNFDAKVRRGSVDPIDLVYGHLGGIDAFARALLIAAEIRRDGILRSHLDRRYASWQGPEGQASLAGATDLDRLEQFILAHDEPVVASGRQEYLEHIINRYI